ncbi:MAG: hypothetical protein OXG55_15125, partial [bacterium]|nr:hypothetical protein [bacterium]
MSTTLTLAQDADTSDAAKPGPAQTAEFSGAERSAGGGDSGDEDGGEHAHHRQREPDDREH